MEPCPKQRQDQSCEFPPTDAFDLFSQGQAAISSPSSVVTASIPAPSQARHPPSSEGEIFTLPGGLSELMWSKSMLLKTPDVPTGWNIVGTAVVSHPKTVPFGQGAQDAAVIRVHFLSLGCFQLEFLI